MKIAYEWIREDLNLVSIVVRITISEAESMIASFDETSSTSPSAADSRMLARPIIEAIKIAMEENNAIIK